MARCKGSWCLAKACRSRRRRTTPRFSPARSEATSSRLTDSLLFPCSMPRRVSRAQHSPSLRWLMCNLMARSLRYLVPSNQRCIPHIYLWAQAKDLLQGSSPVSATHISSRLSRPCWCLRLFALSSWHIARLLSVRFSRAAKLGDFCVEETASTTIPGKQSRCCLSQPSAYEPCL